MRCSTEVMISKLCPAPRLRPEQIELESLMAVLEIHTEFILPLKSSVASSQHWGNDMCVVVLEQLSMLRL